MDFCSCYSLLADIQDSEGPRETNYFLESRNVVPLRSEFKPPPILLSRKGPVVHSSRPPTTGLSELSLRNAESSEDEDEVKARELTLAERQAQAAKEREEKQRKYEERRQELFGPPASTSNNSSFSNSSQQVNGSGTSSPANLTPPGSRSATPSRGRGKGGRRGGGVAGSNPRTQAKPAQHRELYDPSYIPKPDLKYTQRRENGAPSMRSTDIQPIRAPKGPDGSGRGGFGFAHPRFARDDHDPTANMAAFEPAT